jgi:serine/threonine-protein kinase
LQVEELIASSSSEASKIAKRLGGYLLVRELGGGGMARVYQGIPEKGLDASKSVAVKVMHREFAEDPEYKNRFYREIDLCRQLDHPNIVKLLSWGQSENQLFLIMEFVDGGPMSQRLDGRPLGPEAALELLTPLFDAIAYAHGKGVVHRDLKPDNVLLTQGGELKVSDFGLGRESQSDLTETGTTLGTPAYMAPEQIRGVGFEPASDQYALGVISYEVLSGRRPFQHSDPIQLIFLQVSQEPPALAGDLPPQVGEAVMRMLCKQPEQRFPSVEAAGRALLSALREWATAPKQ